MSKNKKTKMSEVFRGFKGLDLSSPVGGGRLTEFRNFRLLPDGSAQKREGFRYLCRLDGEIRGEKAYSDGGEAVVLAVVGNELCRISLSSGEVRRESVFGTNEGRVKFFDFCNGLYIWDGEETYLYTGGCSAEAVVAMPPLYGDGWHSYGGVGAVNEPINLLCPKIRIRYVGTGDAHYRLDVGQKIKSVDGVFYDGEYVIKKGQSDLVSISKDGMSIDCKNWVISDEAIVFLTLDVDYATEDFKSCDRVDVFSSFFGSRAFAYGGEDKGRVYVSKPVKEEDHALAEKFYGRVAPIYFPAVEPMRFGGVDEIKGFCPVYDRMMGFSDYRAFVTSSLRGAEGENRRGVLFDEVSSNVGASSAGAVCRMGGVDPVTVSKSGICRWKTDPDFSEQISFEVISDRVARLLESSFLENALVCCNRGASEIWFGNPASTAGEVLIYNWAGDSWYLFDGINADAFFEAGDTVAFRSGSEYYVFGAESGYDLYEWGESEIEAVIESAPFDFSRPAEKKHVVRAYLSCVLDGGTVELELEDGASLALITLEEGDGSESRDGMDFFDLRMRTGRCECARFRLKAAGGGAQRVYGAEFIAT